jgi:hypothetical protein
MLKEKLGFIIKIEPARVKMRNKTCFLLILSFKNMHPNNTAKDGPSFESIVASDRIIWSSV